MRRGRRLPILSPRIGFLFSPFKPFINQNTFGIDKRRIIFWCSYMETMREWGGMFYCAVCQRQNDEFGDFIFCAGLLVAFALMSSLSVYIIGRVSSEKHLMRRSSWWLINAHKTCESHSLVARCFKGKEGYAEGQFKKHFLIVSKVSIICMLPEESHIYTKTNWHYLIVFLI